MTEENQKLIQKLPDWAAARWNRHVTQVMKDNLEFPGFQDFVTFMLMEAEIACNPITSFQALRSSESPTERRYPKEKRTKSSVLHTQTVANVETQLHSKTGKNHHVCSVKTANTACTAVLSSKRSL